MVFEAANIQGLRNGAVGVKNSHIHKNSPKIVNPRDIARNAEEEEKEMV